MRCSHSTAHKGRPIKISEKFVLKDAIYGIFSKFWPSAGRKKGRKEEEMTIRYLTARKDLLESITRKRIESVKNTKKSN